MAKKLLFVCVENSCRSQIAEAFARRLGGEEVAAESAGSRPSGRVNPKAVASMQEAGCDLATHRSKSLAEVPAGGWDAVVTMGCGDACPDVPGARREDWDLPDPKELDPEAFARVRDEIRTRVEDLLARLGVVPAA